MLRAQKQKRAEVIKSCADDAEAAGCKAGNLSNEIEHTNKKSNQGIEARCFAPVLAGKASEKRCKPSTPRKALARGRTKARKHAKEISKVGN